MRSRKAFGVKVEGQLRALRRLIYCGEWIESHGLHIVMLHAPDFLGFADGIEMAAEHGDMVRQGLALKKAGNEMLRVLGGREIHPVNVRVGGFYRVPTPAELAPARRDAEAGPRRCHRAHPLGGGFPFPEIEQRLRVRGARHPDEYPFNEGRHRLEPRHRHRHHRL